MNYERGRPFLFYQLPCNDNGNNNNDDNNNNDNNNNNLREVGSALPEYTSREGCGVEVPDLG